MKTVLHIDASARQEGSVSRRLSQKIVEKFPADSKVLRRDLADGIPYVTGDHLAAFFTPAENRTEEQKTILAPGSSYIEELRQSDAVVIGVPMYNFSCPAVLKSWVDHVVRSGETFSMGPEGMKGLLEDRPVYIAYASGGVAAGDPVDFLTPWLKTALGFLGITSVEVIAANGADQDPEAVTRAEKAIEALSVDA